MCICWLYIPLWLTPSLHNSKGRLLKARHWQVGIHPYLSSYFAITEKESHQKEGNWVTRNNSPQQT